VEETWSNGCGDYRHMATGARGLAFDAGAQILYVACMQGRVVALDVRDHGRIVSSVELGAGVDMIAFNPGTRHLFAPGKADGTLTVLEADARGALTKLAQYQTAVGSHCVISNNTDRAYACDPGHGQVFVVADPPVQHAQ